MKNNMENGLKKFKGPFGNPFSVGPKGVAALCHPLATPLLACILALVHFIIHTYTYTAHARVRVRECFAAFLAGSFQPRLPS